MLLRIVFSLVLALLCASLFAQTYRTGAIQSPKSVTDSLPKAHIGPQKSVAARAVDLSAYFPAPGNQGQQGSCVAWASAYALKSYQEHIERQSGAFSSNSMKFSPSFIYNQINQGRDEGSTLENAGAILVKYGAATLDAMPYTNYLVQPNANQFAVAAQFKAASAQMLQADDIEAIKYYIQQGFPVVIGMSLNANFQTYAGGVYSVAIGGQIGGHAMCVLGYDDDKQALKLINSWGTGWGVGGYVWISYDLFRQKNFSAMIVQDLRATIPSSPVQPVNLQASQGGFSDKIEVNWQGESSTEYYEVYRSLSPSSGYALAAQVRGTTYYDTEVSQNTVYYYSVCAVVGSNRSGYSSAASGFLQTQQGLGVVNGLSGQWNGQGVRIVWHSVEGASSYNIYRYFYDYGQYMRIGSSYDGGFEDTSVAGYPGTYYYLVTASNSTREGPTSTAIGVVVQNEAVNDFNYDYTNDYYTDYSNYYNSSNSSKAPAVLVSPSSLSASKGTFKDKVTLSWKPVTGVSSYVVLRFDEVNSQWISLATVKKSSFEDTRPQTSRSFYTVVSLVGDLKSEIVGFVEGYQSNIRIEKKKFADDAYYSKKPKSLASPKGNTLSNDDKTLKDSKIFAKNINPQDFFFVDESKNFSIDSDFFGLPKEYQDLSN